MSIISFLGTPCQLVRSALHVYCSPWVLLCYLLCCCPLLSRHDHFSLLVCSLSLSLFVFRLLFSCCQDSPPFMLLFSLSSRSAAVVTPSSPSLPPVSIFSGILLDAHLCRVIPMIPKKFLTLVNSLQSFFLPNLQCLHLSQQNHEGLRWVLQLLSSHLVLQWRPELCSSCSAEEYKTGNSNRNGVH